MALPSDNPLHAEINRYYNIKVHEYSETSPTGYLDAGIHSANGVAKYIGNEEIKIRLFEKLLSLGVERYTFKIRKRLKIEFYSK